MAGRALDSAERVLRRPRIDRERRRSCVPDDHQEPPHRGETHKTEDLGRCSDVPSSPASDAKCRQKTESLFANAFKSLLQQNRHIASIRTQTVRGGGTVGHWSGGDVRPRRSKIQPVVRRSFIFWTK